MSLSRLFHYVIGPELYWLTVCLGIHLLGLRNSPPTEAGSRFLEQFWYWLPFAFVPAGFLLYLLPNAGRWWLLLRLDLATLVGLFIASALLTESVDFQDSRNSGVAAGFIMSVSLGFVVLVVCTLVAIGALWWFRERAVAAA